MVWSDLTPRRARRRRFPNPQTIVMMENSVYDAQQQPDRGVSAVRMTITGNVSGDWQIGDVGPSIPGNTADTLYLVVKDSAGHVATVKHPAPDALLGVDWQQWNVPLSELTSAGVNPARVVKLSIGAGNRLASGRWLCIDDPGDPQACSKTPTLPPQSDLSRPRMTAQGLPLAAPLLLKRDKPAALRTNKADRNRWQRHATCRWCAAGHHGQACAPV
jgi:hypothetical protein